MVLTHHGAPEAAQTALEPLYHNHHMIEAVEVAGPLPEYYLQSQLLLTNGLQLLLRMQLRLSPLQLNLDLAGCH